MPSTETPRILFLDDDPSRAEAFLGLHPGTVWVETAAECVEQLANNWREIYLDHDLGGEMWVDPGREDCGMEVVRIIAEIRPKHLRKTRFIIHSHNYWAALDMVKTLKSAGYRAVYEPFEE